MVLSIDTTNGILVEVKNNKKILGRIIHTDKKKQSEWLILAIKKVLKKANIGLSDIKRIDVANQGGSFTSLRIGISTANALGFGLNVPVCAMGAKNIKNRLVLPKYGSEPNITNKKKI